MTTVRFVAALLITLWGILAADPALARGRRGSRDRNRGERYGSESYRRHDYREGQEWGYGPTWPDYGRPYPGYSPGYINQGAAYADPCAPRLDYPALARDGGRAAGDGFHMSRSDRGKLELGLIIAGTGFDAWTRKKCRENLEKEALAARGVDRRPASFDEPRERIVEKVVYVEREPVVDDRRSRDQWAHKVPTATRTIATNCTNFPVQLFRNNQLLELYPASYGGSSDDTWLDPGETAWVELPKGQSAIAVGPFGAVPAVLDSAQLWVFEPEG